MAFAFLQATHGQDHGAVVPAKLPANSFTASSRHEPTAVDTRMNHVHPVAGQAPVVRQQRGRVLTVGNQEVGVAQNAMNHPAQFTAGRRGLNVFSMHEADVRDSAQLLEHQGDPPFRQTTSTVDRGHTFTTCQTANLPKQTPVLLQTGHAADAPLGHCQWQTMQVEVVSSVEGVLRVVFAQRNRQIPSSPAAMTTFSRGSRL